ncbi:MAG TPA: hypothetical protein VHG89_04840 [Verrucomicrobiae bacterium]|nr:hypothetical protein [Verrucomicrobiae bacterium]
MTPAQKARLVGFNAALSQRGVSVTVQTGAENFLTLALVEVVTEKTREQLQLADDQVSHVLHIRRDVFGNVDRKNVVEIERADSAQTYRVQHFRDDAQRPAILFFCILA